MIAHFQNFWSSVSAIKIGKNVPRETQQAIADAMKSVS